jgi:hypothetical protein
MPRSPARSAASMHRPAARTGREHVRARRPRFTRDAAQQREATRRAAAAMARPDELMMVPRPTTLSLMAGRSRPRWGRSRGRQGARGLMAPPLLLCGDRRIRLTIEAAEINGGPGCWSRRAESQSWRWPPSSPTGGSPRFGCRQPGQAGPHRLPQPVTVMPRPLRVAAMGARKTSPGRGRITETEKSSARERAPASPTGVRVEAEPLPHRRPVRVETDAIACIDELSTRPAGSHHQPAADQHREDPALKRTAPGRIRRRPAAASPPRRRLSTRSS